MKHGKKMWDGRFSGATDQKMDSFNSSLPFDWRLYAEDIEGSIAHCEMLADQGIITTVEKDQIVEGLERIRAQITEKGIKPTADDEDIHMYIERLLVAAIGDSGKKMHTARSRNDQIATDVRLYLKKKIVSQQRMLGKLMTVLADRAEEHQQTIMAGYTHLQPAQPVTLAFYFMAYFFMCQRDYRRLTNVLKSTDVLPLGSGAFAGVNYKIDREAVAKKLGFAKVSENAMDSVSDRDFIIEYLSAVSITIMHLSRMSEELIYWSNSQLGFIEMADSYSTGSSIMPNKKNPDACELVRGKTGRVFGALSGLLTVMKGLPLAYNKDLQEDKECLFDAVDTMDSVLDIFPDLLSTMKVNTEKLKSAMDCGYLQATDVADYLADKGMPFRDAHKTAGAIVRHLEDKKLDFDDLPVEEYQKFSDLFEADIQDRLKYETIIRMKASAGSTSPDSVLKQLAAARKYLSKLKDA